MKRREIKTPKTQKAKESPPPQTLVFDQPKEVRAIARERLGAVKPSHVIVPKSARKKPKYKKPLEEESDV